jgi:hypothetical protein
LYDHRPVFDVSRGSEAVLQAQTFGERSYGLSLPCGESDGDIGSAMIMEQA